MYISVNGSLLKEKEICISPMSGGYMYGYGLFETVKVYEGKAIFIEEHIERLIKGCEELKLKINNHLNSIKEYCDEFILANNLKFGAIKVLYAKNTENYDLIISFRKIIYNEEKYHKGFKLCFANTKKNPYSTLVYVKSNNYLENILEKQRAVDNGYDEAIFLNVNNKISEGTLANIFFVKDKVIYTPSVNCGLLPGIMRDKVMGLVNKLQLDLRIGEFERNELLQADEIFITNSLMDIMPVSKLENREFHIAQNEITQLLMNEYKKIYNSFNY